MPPSTISGINQLEKHEKRAMYARLVPKPLQERFNLLDDFYDEHGNNLLKLHALKGGSMAEMYLYHRYDAQDPILYGQITDTLNGQIHIMLYVINDPDAPRFDVDRMPDGTPTEFGVLRRNIEAEVQAMQAGLAPGQIRSGLRMLSASVKVFEDFSTFLGHDRYFTEPLYYHNAIILERAGFAYQRGRRLMEQINAGFAPGGELAARLDGSTPFRKPQAAESIRLRSWALHDGLLGEPFANVTMYKIVGSHAGVSTVSEINW